MIHRRDIIFRREYMSAMTSSTQILQYCLEKVSLPAIGVEWRGEEDYNLL